MLYGYPYIITEANKLHVFVCQFMRALKAGGNSFSVDDIPPNLKAFTDRSGVLNGKVKDFIEAYHNLPDDAERKKVMDAFVNSNAIELLLSNRRNSALTRVSSLHLSIQEPIRTLFKSFFKDTLKLDDKLQSHYALLYKEIEKTHKKICPFCGLETMVSPRKGMQDYDHLLYKDEYSLAAVNMRNLVPMGIECNRRYKKTSDVIQHLNGDSRPFCYPFKLAIEINLDLSSSPIPNDDDNGEDWVINFQPNSAEVETWAEVFDIRERYIEDVFKLGKFNGWLRGFIVHTRHYDLLKHPKAGDVRNCMSYYLKLIKKKELDDKEFIKYAVFDFLLKKAPDDYFEDLGQEILS